MTSNLIHKNDEKDTEKMQITFRKANKTQHCFKDCISVNVQHSDASFALHMGELSGFPEHFLESALLVQHDVCTKLTTLGGCFQINVLTGEKYLCDNFKSEFKM